MLRGTTESHLSILRVIGRGEVALQVPEEYWLFSNHRNPPVFRLNPFVGIWTDCLLEFGEMEFPLDLTIWSITCVLLQGRCIDHRVLHIVYPV